jgi:general stress protein YciG
MTGNKNKGMGKSNAQDMNQSDSGKMSREEAGRKGGQAQHDERGLEAADKATRERVAREGGKASHGGGKMGSDNS